MLELSLNVLDVAQNSVSAKATRICISVVIHAQEMDIVIEDNGCGMTEQQVNQVIDPFYTTRTTRKVGLGVPFFKMAAEQTGGTFAIRSKVGEGTTVHASFHTDHIDFIPLGDINSTISSLVMLNPDIDFVYRYQVEDQQFTMDTREFRKVLGDVPLNSPDVTAFIREFLTENTEEVSKAAQQKT